MHTTTSPEPLQISGQCRSKYAGTWLYPAQLTCDEIAAVLASVYHPAVPKLHELLVQNRNAPTVASWDELRAKVNKDNLAQAIGGKYYRIASGKNADDVWCHQLWEVRPPAEAALVA